MTGLFVGVDVGTTRIKAVAVDTAGKELQCAERPTPWRHDDYHAETDPARLAELAGAVAAEAAAASAAEPRVLGVGVTGMAETGVLADAADRPLAPAIAWHDPRGDVETIHRELGAEVFQRTTGMRAGPLPSLAKLLWLRRERPETAAAVRFYSVGEWVVRRLGGEPVAELSLASRTGLLDLATARPWPAAAELLGGRVLLPDPVVAGTPAGRAGGEDVPAVLRGAVLTVAGHDHQVAAYGVGAATDGALFNSLGTAEALVRTVRPPLPPERVGALTEQGMSVGWHVVAGHLCVLTGLPTGLTLGRIAALLGVTTAEGRAELSRRALAEPGGHPTLRLVDPRDDHFGLAGITDDVTPPRLWRAVADGLADHAETLLGRIDAQVGPYRRVVAAGGWLRDPVVLAAKRRRFPAMQTTAIAEPGAYGAARLAAEAAGMPLTTTEG
ncbi:FGGY family carbohydrate kinase [Thermopolyspora sp. NPDC052614]|uniref:FGGY-family carbohydrate kinase n=1 Tax=Thermopolyspora sp. NPDC052614 TaxID=3155682 RepID=UPI0034398A2B